MGISILKRLKIGIKFKITFFIVLLVIVMMSTVTYILTIRELNLRVAQVKLRMERLANNIATIRSVEVQDWDVYQSYIDNQLRLNPDIVYIAIFDEGNELKAHALNTLWVDLGYRQTLDPWEQANIVWQLDQRQIAEESQRDLEVKSVGIVVGGQNVGTVKVGFSLVDLNDELRSNLIRNFSLALIFIGLAITVSMSVSQKIVTPLGKLTKAMQRISEGDLEQELHLASRDEIEEMAKTFNFMTKGLREKRWIENFTRELGFQIELRKITGLIVRRISEALDGQRGFLFLGNKDDGHRFDLWDAYPESVKQKLALECTPSFLDALVRMSRVVSLDRLADHPQARDQLRSVLAVDDRALVSPIIVKEELIGLFVLDGRQTKAPYSAEEKAFLETLISQGGFAIENALLLEDLTEQERLQRELEIARRVQQSLLPQQNPRVNGLDIDGVCIPATEVGGDYYDFFPIDDHTLGIAIADVTGKGTSASFYMAVVKGMMLSLVSIFTSPKQLLVELNRRLYGVMDRTMFVTMTYAVVDLKKRRLTFARAGHNALIVRNAEKSDVDCFIPPGLGIGLDEGSLFAKEISEEHIQLKRGDILILYTDGISEAMNAQKEEFGEHRLVNCVKEVDHQNAHTVRENIIRTVMDFVEDTPQHDDMTMVILKAN